MRSRSRAAVLLALATALALLVGGCGASGGEGGGDADGADPGRVLWRAGGTTDTVLDSFANTPWNTEDAEDPRAVESPDVPGRGAVAFTVPGGGKRSELQPRFGTFGEGDRYFFGLSMYLPDDFPAGTDDWQVVAQWKNTGEGSPPISVKIQSNRFVLDGGAGIGESWQRDIGPARTGARNDLVLGIRFSSDPDDARVDVWQDGRHVVQGYHPPSGTLYPDEDSYMKVGLYRDQSIDEEGTVYYDDVVIADGRAAASTLATRP